MRPAAPLARCRLCLSRYVLLRQVAPHPRSVEARVERVVHGKSHTLLRLNANGSEYTKSISHRISHSYHGTRHHHVYKSGGEEGEHTNS